MSKDVFGLLLAVAAIVIAWLWASGRIANVWSAAKGGSAPASEQQTSANQPANAPTGATLPNDVVSLPQVPLPNTATGSPVFNPAAEILAMFGQEQIGATLPTWQTTITPNANNAPAEMTLAPPLFTYA